jgi:hypothetical protein
LDNVDKARSFRLADKASDAFGISDSTVREFNRLSWLFQDMEDAGMWEEAKIVKAQRQPLFRIIFPLDGSGKWSTTL